MLEGLDAIPWKDLEHAYGPAADVPDQLRQLTNPDPKVRGQAMWHLNSNVYHQGTRYPATPYVIPFLIELCANPAVPDRGGLLHFWGRLITGFFSVRERPLWGDGQQIYSGDETMEAPADDPLAIALHEVYRESLKGYGLLGELLSDADPQLRGQAAWVLAALRTMRTTSVPLLTSRLKQEPLGWIRATIAFALGELGAAEPLREILAHDQSPAARCVAACELARIAPSDALVQPLLQFVAEPLDNAEMYDNIPGAGGKSTGDAAHAVSLLSPEVQRAAIPALCDQLEQARSFDTMPLVNTLLAAAFTPRKEPITNREELTDLQRHVLLRMVGTEEFWSIGNLLWTFKAYGLEQDRKKCAALVGVRVNDDPALKALSTGLSYAQIGFLDVGRQGILEALKLDPTILDRAPAPDETWLLCAKAFAPTDPTRAVEAFRRACALNPTMKHRVDPRWALADLIKRSENG